MRCEHAHSRAEHRLSHDQVAHLRLLEPGESARVQEVFDQMSGHSRFLRFHAATPRLTGQALRYLSAVRPGRHSAVVALLEGRAIGLARWVRLHHEPGTAELAADVGDAYQGRGLGRALVAAAAAHAADWGIDCFLATVHPDNRLVRAALHSAGARRGTGEQNDFLMPVAALVRTGRPPARDPRGLTGSSVPGLCVRAPRPTRTVAQIHTWQRNDRD